MSEIAQLLLKLKNTMSRKEVAFQPGKFTPVVEVSQRDSGIPAPAETSFVGLEEVSKTTLLVATAASSGRGAVIADPTPVPKLALIIGTILTIRNVVEQLQFLGVHCRVGTPASKPNGEFLEPLIRAYQYYGHFLYDGKTFVARGLGDTLVKSLFRLKNIATNEVRDGLKWTSFLTDSQFQDLEMDFYYLNESGDIGFGKQYPLKEYIEKLVSYVSENDGLGNVNFRLPLLLQILEISTEDALRRFLRYARTLEGWNTPTRDRPDTPSDKHKAAMKKLFGKDYSSPDDVIPNASFVTAVNNAYALLRRVSLERSYGMKTIRFPKYEGGSASQLASSYDDVLYSTVPLSLSDSTAAQAFETSYGCIMRHHSAPGHERDELLRELVSQSLI